MQYLVTIIPKIMARVLDNIEWLELGKVLSSNKKRAIRGRTKPLGHPFPFYQF